MQDLIITVCAQAFPALKRQLQPPQEAGASDVNTKKTKARNQIKMHLQNSATGF